MPYYNLLKQSIYMQLEEFLVTNAIKTQNIYSIKALRGLNLDPKVAQKLQGIKK